jgi:uncharacterized protein YdeI (YjbR/CyaY-like superfamily)
MPIKSPEVLVPSAKAWRAWLSKNHSTVPLIWLVVVRPPSTKAAAKGSTSEPISITTLTPSEALDEALCFGWVDSGGGRRDEATQTHYLRFTPRRVHSAWSVRNTRHVERLEGEGRLAPPGLEAIRIARETGMWAAAYSSDPPSDLAKAVRDGGALVQKRWGEMKQGEKYQLYVRLGSVPMASERRSKRINAIIDLLREDKDEGADKAKGEEGHEGEAGCRGAASGPVRGRDITSDTEGTRRRSARLSGMHPR